MASIYFAELGNNWGYTFGEKPERAFYSLYDEGGVFGYEREFPTDVSFEKWSRGMCLTHKPHYRQCYCATSQEVMWGGLILHCTGFGRAKLKAIKNLESCFNRANDDLEKLSPKVVKAHN